MGNYLICFSPTGGTKAAGEILCKEFGEFEMIDLSQQNFAERSFHADDCCVMAVPAFGGRVPAVALERLSKLQGSGALAVSVAVFGERAIDDTLLELNEQLTASGFVVIASIEAVAEHSLARQYGHNRPDKEDQVVLQHFMTEVKQKIASGLRNEPEVPGNRPFHPYGGVPVKPTASSKCNACGECVLRCPIGAIPKENPRLVHKEVCISCMRCVTICPLQARSIPFLLRCAIGFKLRKLCAERKPNRLYK